MSAATARPPLVEEPPRDTSVWRATGREAPVFFDHRGHRRHWVRGGGALAVVLAAAWLCGLVGGAVGFATLPSPIGVLRPFVQRHEVFALEAPLHTRVIAHREFASVHDRESAHTL